MASNATAVSLGLVIADVDELIRNHAALRTGSPGRQFGLNTLNRAAVVMLVSAWESYIEALAIETAHALRPVGNNLGVWPALVASLKGSLGRFNTPNSQNVEKLFADHLGVPDLPSSWRWRNGPARKNAKRLDRLLENRHKVAHGVSPRPRILHGYVTQMRSFVSNLADATDRYVRDYLTTQYGLKPWP